MQFSSPGTGHAPGKLGSEGQQHPGSSVPRRSLGVRAKILAIGLVGLFVAVLLTGVSLWSLNNVSNSSQNMKSAYEVQVNATWIDQLVSDLNGQQNGYLLEAATTGAKAVEPSSPSRKAYLKDLDDLNKQIAEIQPQLITDAGKKSLGEVKGTLQQWVANDEKVVAAVKEKSMDKANELAVVEAGKIMEALSAQTEALTTTAQNRVKNSQDEAESARSTAVVVSAVTLTVAALGLIFLAWRVSGAILVAVRKVLASVQAMDSGDLRVAADVTVGDEIGDMARALDQSRESIRSVLQQVGDASATVAAASEELTATSGQMRNSASLSSERAGAAAQSASEVSTNVQTVAAGTEEMTASIREISKNANDAANVAASAVAVADQTNATVAKLGDSSTQIGEVVKTITTIAEQTNLLALNATIEAARAGEAGKGFAVVANEVKDLAQETSKATEDIGHRVEQIQVDTQAAVAAISEISAIIAQINDTQATIASAVEEQTATTNEMGRNVSEAASGASQIANYVDQVSQASGETTSAVEDTSRAAEELAGRAHQLQDLVGKFRF
ncbi:hypothetical protein KEM60_01503 [Austwickia sp. TVS 96-490-7B]|uniref:methyl-accepting chemotaxis protein n=1 Tax=Austwickia sp. TVS 96-490-7B TaxID=2830843 RepID=UPI001C58902C|nr:methyl-accepting chemotaxis protein [Austwickia sp. TVS 96-490-7B]MBW3085306.1 hypothetical protein [Austwickia sp. TVS 96-490-7B]